jgi:predicted pyridoxine 5'-phosphate oxidase superfamily flavin-nucleotide-binding protein
MKLTAQLPDDRRAHVEGRLRANLMAWLTTVRPDGRPDSVPVWFLLRDDETILIYSQTAKIKLRNISLNPRVTLGYAERIGAKFGTPSRFAELFPEALIITPDRLHA